MVGFGVRGFDKGSRPVLRTFDYRLVAGVGTFEFHRTPSWIGSC